jgi:iron complex outermembrane receptor protein
MKMKIVSCARLLIATVLKAAGAFSIQSARARIALACASATIISLGAPIGAHAQGAIQNAASTTASASPKDEDLQEIIVTGTRDPRATAANSVSPVTVLGADQLATSGAPDLRDALIDLSPSITKSSFDYSYATGIDKISMEGLPSDDTLILINGIRRHTSGTIGDGGGPENGTAPSDLGTFPSSAIDHIEILTDGASALYGSDAIAGVVNFILKKNDHGVEISTINGITAAGDGFTSDTTLNAGFKLFGSGFLSISAEFFEQDHAYRSNPDNREPIINGAGTVLFPVGATDANRTFSTPSQDRDTFSYNAGVDLSDSVQLYSFATYSYRTSSAFQNYRPPSKLPQVFPNGFTPATENFDNDYAGTLGLKGTVGGWDWDVSGTYGNDHTNFYTSDTVNTALYAATGFTPTTVYNGASGVSEATADVNIRRSFDVGLAGPVNLAFGGEYRYDTYTLGAGDEASVYGGGTQGAGGYYPAVAVYGVPEDVEAAYVDLALEPIKNLKVDLAGRYENYSRSGGKSTGKISARYDFSPAVALRGTASTGFRAPTLAEQYYSILGVSPNGASGQLPVSSAAAKYLGAQPLKPETSTNISAGLVLRPIDGLTATIDAFQIDIDKRILTGAFYNGQAAITAFSLLGIGLNPGTDPAAVSAQYFTNGADTQTRGLNFALNYITKFDGFRIDWDGSGNFTSTKILRSGVDLNGNPLLNAAGASYLTTDIPAEKITFGGHLTSGRFDLSLHEIFWGSTQTAYQYTAGPNAFSATDFYTQYNKPNWETNIELGYKVTDWARLSIGATNLFNAFPTKLPQDVSYYGVYKYDWFAQGIGILGAYYYAGVKLTL